MMINDPVATALEQALRLLSQRVAPSAEFCAAAEEMRGSVRRIDEAEAAAPQRRASILTITHQTDRVSRLDKIVAAVQADDAARCARALQREIAVSFAAQLDARAREAKKAEAARDEARKPFAELTGRVQETAKRLATYPALAERAVVLLITDFRIRSLTRSAYASVPRNPDSRCLGVVRGDIPLATSEFYRDLILPRICNGQCVDKFLPLRASDLGFFESGGRSDEADADIIGELASFAGSRPSERAVDQALPRAHARLLAEVRKVIGSIADLMALDASIGDVHQRYPDGGLVWDECLFPEWKLKQMSRWIVLPARGGHRVAAE